MSRVWTPERIKWGIEKLEKRKAEVEVLSMLVYSDQQVRLAEFNVTESVREVFGEDSPEFLKFSGRTIAGSFGFRQSAESKQAQFREGIPATIVFIDGLIARLVEKQYDLGVLAGQSAEGASPPPLSTRVFVVHGHDEGAKQAVARVLEKLELEPVILHEQASAGRTVIEKVEHFSDVGYAVVLLSGDDLGGPVDGKVPMQPRARQNVVLELGYFVGRLGRERVCALVRDSVEIPSDWAGVVYVGMDNAGGWQLLLGKELRSAGFPVDVNQLL